MSCYDSFSNLSITQTASAAPIVINMPPVETRYIEIPDVNQVIALLQEEHTAQLNDLKQQIEENQLITAQTVVTAQTVGTSIQHATQAPIRVNGP